MNLRMRLLSGAAAGALALGAALPSAMAVVAQVAPATLTIGVDNASPAGDNFEFLDYYPRENFNVHNGDTIAFHVNAGSADAFHTVALGACQNAGSNAACTAGAATETAAAIFGKFPGVVPDTDSGATTGDAPGQLLFNNAVTFANNPPPGSGAPGACGDATTPCNWDGSRELNSGSLVSSAGGPFATQYFFKINLASAPASPVTVHYVCLIHGPVMSGNFTVVPNATTSNTQADIDSQSATQFAGQTAAGQAAKAAANSAAVTLNGNGTHNYALSAGTETADHHVQVLEMLPSPINIQAGDTVSWTALSAAEIHTVTFPQGHGSDSVDPLQQFCENAGGTDTAPNFGGAGPPCAAANFPANFETHFNLGPVGGIVISSPATVATSGIVDNGLIPGTPGAYSFSFPNAGTFNYQCRIHDHMTGQVLAAAVAVPSPTPSAALLAQTGTARSLAPIRPAPWQAAVALLMALVGGLLWAGERWRRSA